MMAWNSNIFANANTDMANMLGQNNLTGQGVGMFSGTPGTDQTGFGGNLQQGASGWNTFSNILGGVNSAVGAFTGLKQLGLAKKQFQWGKDVFNTNLFNQANLVNSQLADRQNRRNYFDPNSMSATDYVAKYGAASSMQEATGRQAEQANSWTKSKSIGNAKVGG